MDRTPLTPTERRAALAGLPHWRQRLGALHTAYRAGTVAQALELVAGIGRVAEELDHHPDVDWRHRLVFVRTTTHSAGGAVTAHDVALAGRVSALAVGLEAVPGLCRTVELGVDTDDPDRLRDWWAAALGYRPAGDDDLVDPYGRGPTIWFQVTGTPADNRMHLDVHVAQERAEEVVGATAAAGGRVDPAHAPAFTVLTDPDGNRVCVCTPLGRDDPA